MAEFKIGPLYTRCSPEGLPAGHVIPGHRHNFDHVTFVWGRIKFECLEPISLSDSGEPIEFKTVNEVVIDSAVNAYPWLLIEKGTYHRLTVLQEGSKYGCFFPHRRPDTEEVVEEYTGWPSAYI